MRFLLKFRRMQDAAAALTRDAGARTISGARVRAGARGFTLLEVITVVGIILILATLAAGRYDSSLVRAHEAALHQDLSEMRKAIDNYTADKDAGPSSLDDLVQAGYLHQVPNDPMTHSPDWRTDQDCSAVMSPDQTVIGICDVHSASDGVSPFENTPYSSW